MDKIKFEKANSLMSRINSIKNIFGKMCCDLKEPPEKISIKWEVNHDYRLTENPEVLSEEETRLVLDTLRKRKKELEEKFDKI